MRTVTLQTSRREERALIAYGSWVVVPDTGTVSFSCHHGNVPSSVVRLGPYILARLYVSLWTRWEVEATDRVDDRGCCQVILFTVVIWP